MAAGAPPPYHHSAFRPTATLPHSTYALCPHTQPLLDSIKAAAIDAAARAHFGFASMMQRLDKKLGVIGAAERKAEKGLARLHAERDWKV